MNQVRIEVIHTAGCAHWRAARDRIEVLARREGIPVVIVETRVDTVEDAAAQRFRGSPTILVEGRDVEPRAAQGPADYGLG